MNEPKAINPMVSEAIDSLGGDSAVQKLAGLETSWAVAKWRKSLPAGRVLWLAEQTDWKYTPHQLGPELYPNQYDGVPPNKKRVAAAAAAERSLAHEQVSATS